MYEGKTQFLCAKEVLFLYFWNSIQGMIHSDSKYDLRMISQFSLISKSNNHLFSKINLLIVVANMIEFVMILLQTMCDII